jgi:hypothetical protein
MAAKKKVALTGSDQASAEIRLKRLVDITCEVAIVGLTPVIPHKWSQKSLQMMPGHPDKPLVSPKKGRRNPKEEAEACVYRLPNGKPGIPATAFKSAIIDACRFFDKPSMKEAKLWFYVIGEGPDQLVEIKGKSILREDTPRNANGSADLRYRYAFDDWSATLRIRFPEVCTDADSVAALVDAAGRCGVGDWRPSAPKSNTGTFGTWRADEHSKEASNGD